MTVIRVVPKLYFVELRVDLTGAIHKQAGNDLILNENRITLKGGVDKLGITEVMKIADNKLVGIGFDVVDFNDIVTVPGVGRIFLA